MEKIRTPLIIVVGILIVVFGYITYQSMTNKPSIPVTSEKKITEPSIASEAVVLLSPTESLQTDWETYSSIPLSFSISHPSDLLPKKQSETIVFSKWGPSQKEDTEFYDGLQLTLSFGSYDGAFESLVNQKLEEIKDWPTYVSSTDIKALTLADKEAYSFEAITMGKATYYFIKKSPTEYFEIIDATNDPTDQGFKEIITKMLISLKLN